MSIEKAFKFVDSLTKLNVKNTEIAKNISTQEYIARAMLIDLGYEEYVPRNFRYILETCGIDRNNYEDAIGSAIGLEDGFCFQPFGTQSNPDAFWVVSNCLFSLNFKSAKTNNIKWNSTLPKDREIYVISPGTHSNLFFLGEHLITQEERTVLEASTGMYRQYSKQLRMLEKKFGSRWGSYARIDLCDYHKKIDYAKIASEMNTTSNVKEFIKSSIDSMIPVVDVA
jgi:hypothetical protein